MRCPKCGENPVFHELAICTACANETTIGAPYYGICGMCGKPLPPPSAAAHQCL